MDRTRRSLLGIAGTAAALSLAGCTGDGDGGDGGATTTAPSTDPGTTTGGGTTAGGTDGDATVQVRDHPELGEILVDADGMTLYMFDSDTRGAGESTCGEGCVGNWPPLTVSGDASSGSGVTASLSTFDRTDGGGTQVAANGWPLYYWAGDGSPGDVNGQGVGDVWWVLRPDGTPVRATDPTTTAGDETTTADGGGDDTTQAPTTAAPSATVEVRSHDTHGDILVDADGMTLYMFDSDSQGSNSSSCSGSCAGSWPPLTVEGTPNGGDGVTAPLTTFERGDGAMQVAADGWPLYYYAGDESPGDASGQGLNGAWWVLAPDGTPMRDDGDSVSY